MSCQNGIPKMRIPNGGKKYGGGKMGPPVGYVKPRRQSPSLNFDVFSL